MRSAVSLNIISHPCEGHSIGTMISVGIVRPFASSAGAKRSAKASLVAIGSRSYPGRLRNLKRVTTPPASTSSSSHARVHASCSIAAALYGAIRRVSNFGAGNTFGGT